MNNDRKEVLSLFVSKKKVKKIQLDTKGVIGDKYYNTNKNRSVLISSIKSYNVSKSNNIEVPDGGLGENIIVNFDIYSLKVGTKFQIGTALLQISQNCTLCNSLAKIDPKLPKILKDDRGIFAFVLKEGEVQEGDEIIILEGDV